MGQTVFSCCFGAAWPHVREQPREHTYSMSLLLLPGFFYCAISTVVVTNVTCDVTFGGTVRRRDDETTRHTRTNKRAKGLL